MQLYRLCVCYIEKSNKCCYPYFIGSSPENGIISGGKVRSEGNWYCDDPNGPTGFPINHPHLHFVII